MILLQKKNFTLKILKNEVLKYVKNCEPDGMCLAYSLAIYLEDIALVHGFNCM